MIWNKCHKEIQKKTPHTPRVVSRLWGRVADQREKLGFQTAVRVVRRTEAVRKSSLARKGHAKAKNQETESKSERGFQGLKYSSVIQGDYK